MKATTNPELLTDEEKVEAVRLTKAGLGKAELETVRAYPSPLVCTVNDQHGVKWMKGGTLFFLDTGTRTFAVTAAHVLQEYRDDSKYPDVHASIACNGKRPLRISFGDRVIDANAEIDIATFDVLPDEIDYSGMTVLSCEGMYQNGCRSPRRLTVRSLTAVFRPCADDRCLARSDSRTLAAAALSNTINRFFVKNGNGDPTIRWRRRHQRSDIYFGHTGSVAL